MRITITDEEYKEWVEAVFPLEPWPSYGNDQVEEFRKIFLHPKNAEVWKYHLANSSYQLHDLIGFLKKRLEKLEEGRDEEMEELRQRCETAEKRETRMETMLAVAVGLLIPAVLSIALVWNYYA